MKGFTLIELLVVSGVVLLLTALIIPGWRAGEGSLALQRAASKVEQDIRRTIELSQHAKWHDCTPPPSERIAGYGIYFDSATQTSYFVFADCNNNQRYDSATDDKIETIEIESPVRISAVTGTGFGITVVPPDPAFFLKDGAGSTLASAQIILQNNATATKTITISQKGVVSIE